MRHRSAFTLIELLVVIAIIAILAAILFPVFANAKISAKKAGSMSNLKQLAASIYLYANDQSDCLPLSGWKIGTDTLGNQNCYSWRWAVLPYVRDTPTYVSSKNSYADLDYGWVCPWFFGGSWPAEPIDAMAGIKISYAGANSWANNGTVAWWTNGDGNTGIDLGQVPRISSLLMIVESKYAYEDLGTWTLDLGPGLWTDPAGTPGSGPMTDYNGKVNFAFFDTHVKSYQPCATFGALNWNYGDVPPDDYLWEWWAGVDPDTLRGWQQNCYQNGTEYR